MKYIYYLIYIRFFKGIESLIIEINFVKTG